MYIYVIYIYINIIYTVFLYIYIYRVTWSNIVQVGLAYMGNNSMDIESRGVSPSLS